MTSSLTSILADRGTRTKILVLLGVCATVSAVIGAVSIGRMATLNANAHTLYTGNVATIDTLGNVRIGVVQTRLDVLNHGLSDTAADHTKFAAKITADDAVAPGRRGLQEELDRLQAGAGHAAPARQQRRSARGLQPDP